MHFTQTREPKHLIRSSQQTRMHGKGPSSINVRGVNKDLPSFIKDAFETHRQGTTGFLTHSAYSGRKIDHLEQPFIRNTVANYEDTMLLQEIARNNLNST